MTTGLEPASPPGLRARKKQQTHAALLREAERLFEAHGYDNVTVAQIADAANISVKTLFTYFASKEDLAFGDADRLCHQLVAAVTTRPAGAPVIDAVAACLREMVRRDDPGGPAAGLEGYHRAVGDSPALQSRLRRMWTDYEDAMTATIVATTPGIGPSSARLEAMLSVGLVRSLTSQEVRTAVGSAPDPHAALLTWIETAARRLKGS